MGIVFEPMYDPNNPSVQRGVRICDLPRTGAAALSRKLEIGDELLSINDKTMSRLTFDEIMDFIIEADPDQVNLLFRRPRKGSLPTRLGPKPMTTPPNASVKWPDDDLRNKKEKKKSSTKEKEKEKKEEKKEKKRSKRDEDSTVVSEEDTLEDRLPRRNHRSSKDMYENESFLDISLTPFAVSPMVTVETAREEGTTTTTVTKTTPWRPWTIQHMSLMSRTYPSTRQASASPRESAVRTTQSPLLKRQKTTLLTTLVKKRTTGRIERPVARSQPRQLPSHLPRNVSERKTPQDYEGQV